jgi:L-aminopeptidase/D-esterase-like protein
MHDGDTVFVMATGADGGARLDSIAVTRVAVFAVDAVERATLDAVRSATAAGGLPAAGG